MNLLIVELLYSQFKYRQLEVEMTETRFLSSYNTLSNPKYLEPWKVSFPLS